MPCFTTGRRRQEISTLSVRCRDLRALEEVEASFPTNFGTLVNGHSPFAG